MWYEFFLARRYLLPPHSRGFRLRARFFSPHSRHNGRRSVAHVTALAAAVGIAFGVAALIVAVALANGFRNELQDKILSGTAHITLAPQSGLISERRLMLARLRAVKGVADAAATTYTGALLSGPKGAAYSILRGVDADSAQSVLAVRRTLLQGEVEDLFRTSSVNLLPNQQSNQQQAMNEERGDTRSLAEAAPIDAVIGVELAARTGLEQVGDTGQLVTLEGDVTSGDAQPRYASLRVAGIFRSGLYEYDASWAYVSLQGVNAFSGTPAAAAAVINITVEDINQTAQVAERARAGAGQAGEYTTVTWQEANRPLFAALALERRIVTIIILLIMIIAALNITTMLALLVVERRGDIAVLSAMGATPQSIMCVFIIEGASVGLFGAICGAVLGTIACFVGDRYQIVQLPADVYSLGAVPLQPRARDTFVIAFVAFVISVLATIYPAQSAARLRPAEALRDA